MDYQTPVTGNDDPQQQQTVQDIMAMLQKQRSQNQSQQNKMPMLSWTQVAGGILNTLADKIQDQRVANRMAGGQSDFLKALVPGNQNVTPGPTQQGQQSNPPTQTGDDTSSPPTQTADNSDWSTGDSWG